METGNGRTEDRGGLTRNEENVIRLPRDWLGPPEELVPIGPAARARAAQRDAEEGLPPTADAFWSEDSAALHDAVQAPQAQSPERLDPPAGLIAPVAGRPTRRLGRVGRVRRGSWSWSVLAIPVVALLVLAVIGSSEGPAPQPATHAKSSHSTGGAQVASTSQAASGGGAAAKLKARATTHRHVTAHHRTLRSHARTRAHVRHPAKLRHPAAASHRAAGSSPPTVTQAAASTPATHPSTSAPAETTPTASAASSIAGAGSSPATTGPAGPTGIGSVSGGCSPKCS